MQATGAERWLGDEMLGRLTRYLRILGCDTEYARGLPDAQVEARALAEHRTLVTRDVALAHRVPGSILIVSTDIAGQLREMWRARPALGRTPRFDRCTKCNGPLLPVPEGERELSGVPPAVLRKPGPAPVYRCARCGQPYWEGSHTRQIRARLVEAASAVPP